MFGGFTIELGEVGVAMSNRLFRFLVSPFGKLGKVPSLYEKVGGEAKIEDIVDLLYRKVLEDDHLNVFFDDVCMHYQRYKLRVFLTMVLGGPIQFTGKDLRSAHARLVENGMNDSHFDQLAVHLRSTLETLDLRDHEIEEVMSLTESTRSEVLGR